MRKWSPAGGSGLQVIPVKLNSGITYFPSDGEEDVWSSMAGKTQRIDRMSSRTNNNTNDKN